MSTTIPAPAAAAAPPVDRARFLHLFSVVMLPMFLAAVDQTVLATATTAIGRELGHLADMSWLATGYLLASVLTVPLYGRLGDERGRRRLLRAAIAIFTVGSLACGLAPGFEWLVAARVLQGLGGGGLMSLSQALIGEVLPPQQRARWQAWFAIVFVAASVVGPVVGGAVVHHASWRWLFLANLPLAGFALWRLATLEGEDSRHPRPGRFDGRGLALFALAIVTTLWLLAEGGQRMDWTSPAAAATAALALVAWAVLARHERRLQRAGGAPFLPVELLREPAVRVSVAVVCGFAAVMFSIVFYLPLYMHAAFASSAAESGALLLPVTGGILVGSGLAGRLIVWTGRLRELPLAGMTLAALCLAGLATLAPARGGVIGLGFGTGLGLGMVMSVAQIVTQLAAGPARLGAAAATVSLARSLGASVGAAAFGALVFGGSAATHGAAALTADPAATAALVPAFRIAFAAATGVAALTAFAASRLPAMRVDGSLPVQAAVAE